MILELVRGRYPGLDLTQTQAEQIHQFEDAQHGSKSHYFTEWEYADYTAHFFATILTSEQFDRYKLIQSDRLANYIEGLRNEDLKRTNEIAYHKALLAFYENSFLPDLFQAKQRALFGTFRDLKSKTDLVKTEYKSYLDNLKWKYITEHFRNYRTYAPLAFELARLRLKLNATVPDYWSFKNDLDNATKAVISFLVDRIKVVPIELEQLLENKREECNKFSKIQIPIHYSDIKGWQTTSTRRTDYEVLEEKIMFLILLEIEKYGC